MLGVRSRGMLRRGGGSVALPIAHMPQVRNALVMHKRPTCLSASLNILTRHDRAGGAVPTPCHHAVCAFANGAKIFVLLRATSKALTIVHVANE